MKRFPVVAGAFLMGVFCVAWSVGAEDTGAATQPDAKLSAADSAADKRAASIVSSLDIDDPAKSARVHDVIVAQYAAIHQWHSGNDAKRKALSTTQPSGTDADEAKAIQASYQSLHDHFITALSADLTPDQIDKVKEKMTGGQMTATLRNYPVIVPNLSDEEMAMVRRLLLEARDDAMDSGSRNERIAIFKKYKGKINVYLNSHGHNVGQAYKDWGKAQKAKQAAATQPEAN